MLDELHNNVCSPTSYLGHQIYTWVADCLTWEIRPSQGKAVSLLLLTLKADVDLKGKIFTLKAQLISKLWQQIPANSHR